MAASPKSPETSDAALAHKVLVVGVVAALAAVVWMLSDLLLLFFGSALLAILITVVARPLSDVGLPHWIAVIAVVSAFLIVAVGLAGIFGGQMAGELEGLYARLAEARRWWDDLPLGRAISSLDQEVPAASLIPSFASWTVSVGTAVIAAVLLLFGALYLALDSRTYVNGFLTLVPDTYLSSVRATLDESQTALERWLKAQVVIMMVVGALTGAGLTLIGMQSAIALGFLAGVANFVPYVGSIAAGAVILVVAAAHSWSMVLWAGGVLFVVQQIESNVLQPVIGANAVALPPAVALYAIAAMGLLFGPLGLLLGFPLTVVTDIAIRQIYVRDILDRPVDIVGESTN